MSETIVLTRFLRTDDIVRVVEPSYKNNDPHYQFPKELGPYLGLKGEVIGITLHDSFQANYPCPISKPGVYYAEGYPIVKFGDGVGIRVSPQYLEFVDETLKENRRKIVGTPVNDRKAFKGPLPDTKFTELDRVKCGDKVPRHYNETGKVEMISYDKIGSFCDDDVTPYPIYVVRLDSGGSVAFREEELELTERGNVWKRLNGEELSFASLEEECLFRRNVGEATELKNPSNGLYSWTLGDVMDALAMGEAHCLVVSNFLGVTKNCVYKMHDEKLGAKIAALTIEGFKDTPQHMLATGG